jgi:hypothetical protein
MTTASTTEMVLLDTRAGCASDVRQLVPADANLVASPLVRRG